MSERKKKILAYIGLGFMAVFSVFLVMFFIDMNMWNGTVAFITLFSGVCAIAILFYIKQFSKNQTDYLSSEQDLDDNLIEDESSEISNIEDEPIQNDSPDDIKNTKN